MAPFIGKKSLETLQRNFFKKKLKYYEGLLLLFGLIALDINDSLKTIFHAQNQFLEHLRGNFIPHCNKGHLKRLLKLSYAFKSFFRASPTHIQSDSYLATMAVNKVDGKHDMKAFP